MFCSDSFNTNTVVLKNHPFKYLQLFSFNTKDTLLSLLCCCSVAQWCLTLCNPMHTRLLCPSLSPGVFLNSCPLLWWCHPTSSASVAPFSSSPQYFPASGAFPVNRLFVSGGQSIGASASASVLPMNIQGWFPLGLTALISLLSKGLSQEFSPAPQFKSINSSVWSNCHIHTCCCCCC